MELLSHFKRWSKQEFTRNSFTLLSTSTLAQLITFVVYPVITRLYAAQDLGVLNLWLSIIAVLAILSTGRYEPAIVMEKENSGARALWQLTILINIIVLIIGQLIFSIFAHPIASLCKNPEGIEPWLPYIPLMVLLMGLWQGLNHYCIRRKRFKAIGEYNLTKSAVNSGLKVGFGYAGFLSSGLITSTLIAFASALFLALLRVKVKIRELFCWNWQEMKAMAKKYANFPKFEMPHAMSNTLASNLPILILPLSFGMDQIGLFSLALMIGFCPVNLFTNSMDQVLYKNVVDRRQKGEEVLPLIGSFCKKTALLLLPFFVVFFFIAEWFFGILFGTAWIQAGIYFKILLPWLFLVTMTSSLTFIPKIFFKQRTAMLIEFSYIILRVMALCIGIWMHSFVIAIVCFSAVSAMMVAVQLGWYFCLIKRNEPCRM